MDIVCASPVFTNWRGESGNYAVLVTFTVPLLLNLVVGVAVMVMKTDSKLSKCFLSKYFFANFVVVANQLYHSAGQLGDDGLNCVHTLSLYLTHQMGLMASTTSLLIMIGAHHRHLSHRYMLTPAMRDSIFRHAVYAQILVDFLGVVLICLPFIPMGLPMRYQFLLFFFGMGFDILANIVLIVFCLRVKHGFRRRLSRAMHSRHNAAVMRRTFAFLRPTIWASAIPRMAFHVLHVVPSFLSEASKQKSLVALRWTGLSYYVSFIILPLLVTMKNNEIKQTVDALAVKARLFFKREVASDLCIHECRAPSVIQRNLNSASVPSTVRRMPEAPPEEVEMTSMGRKFPFFQR